MNPNPDPDHGLIANQESALIKRGPISVSQRFEIRAEAFRLETGLMAPGKDSRDGNTEEERAEAWKEWNEKNRKIIDAFFYAAGKILY